METINVDVDNLEEFLTQKQKERVDSILLIINSDDRSNEEKERLLRKRNKKDLKKVAEFLESIRNTFIISSLKTGERRIFSLKEFECKNTDYIDKNNLIKIYLGEYPRLSSIDRKAFWFEALLQCLVLGYLPLYWDSGDKVDTSFYKRYTVRELRKILTRDIEEPVDIWDDIENAKKRSVSISNLVRFYNLRNPDTPWPKSNTSFSDIQVSLGTPISLEKDPEGIDKDIIIYYMILTGNRDSEMSQIKSSIIYEKLGFVESPQTIQELFTMDTEAFNNNRDFVRRELTRRWREIPTICGELDENFSLGISRKIKYCYIANNIKEKYPKNLTFTSHIDDLLDALRVIERDYE